MIALSNEYIKSISDIVLSTIYTVYQIKNIDKKLVCEINSTILVTNESECAQISFIPHDKTNKKYGIKELV